MNDIHLAPRICSLLSIFPVLSTADYSYYDQTPTPAQRELPVRSAVAPAQTKFPDYQDQYAAPVQQEPQTYAPTQTQDYGYQPQSAYQQPSQPSYQQPIPQQPAPAPVQQQQPFLDGSSAPQPAQPGPPPRVNSMYGDWMAPAAGAAAGAGAGLMGAEYWRNQRNKAAARDEAAEPGVSAAEPMAPQERELKPADVSNPTDVDVNGGVVQPSTSTSTSVPLTAVPTTGDSGLGGLESKGARETGRFPTVVRHDTSVSISALHVPGEYPKKI